MGPKIENPRQKVKKGFNPPPRRGDDNPAANDRKRLPDEVARREQNHREATAAKPPVRSLRHRAARDRSNCLKKSETLRVHR